MSNTVINIYGDIYIDHISIRQGTSIGKAVSDSIRKSIFNEERNDDCHAPMSKPEHESPCYDHYGRWSNEAQRNSWNRFYSANGFSC